MYLQAVKNLISFADACIVDSVPGIRINPEPPGNFVLPNPGNGTGFHNRLYPTRQALTTRKGLKSYRYLSDL